MNNVESRLQRCHPGRLQLLFNDPAYSIGRYRTRSIIIILQFKRDMDDSMKQIVSYIETHNTRQNEKIQKLQQANQEQHKIIMFL